MTLVDLEGVIFTTQVEGEDYAVRKEDLEATEFYVDMFSDGVSIAPENHDGDTTYTCIDPPPEAAEKLANAILEKLQEADFE